MCHREKLPLTMKSCVYPLIGDAIFSWIGDVIDIITIMCSLFGVCVNLVIASRQMNMGLSILYSKIDPDNIIIQVIFSTKFLGNDLDVICDTNPRYVYLFLFQDLLE